MLRLLVAISCDYQSNSIISFQKQVILEAAEPGNQG
jgi:hypothetical protein